MQRKRRQTIGIVAVAISTYCLVGCTTRNVESFTPLERVEGQTFEGYTEAVYDLAGTAGRFGEAKVWTKGAFIPTNDDQTVIHIGLDIENGGQEPIVVNPSEIRLESVQTDKGVLQNVPVSIPTRATAVRANSTGRVELYFELPAQIDPSDIDAFRVAWRVQSDGQEFTEFTPFAHTEPAAYYVPVNAYYYPYYSYNYPFYDPYWYPASRVQIVKRYPRRVIVRGHRPI